MDGRTLAQRAKLMARGQMRSLRSLAHELVFVTLGRRIGNCVTTYQGGAACVVTVDGLLKGAVLRGDPQRTPSPIDRVIQAQLVASGIVWRDQAFERFADCGESRVGTRKLAGHLLDDLLIDRSPAAANGSRIAQEFDHRVVAPPFFCQTLFENMALQLPFVPLPLVDRMPPGEDRRKQRHHK